jgi:hypothetical protein
MVLSILRLVNDVVDDDEDEDDDEDVVNEDVRRCDIGVNDVLPLLPFNMLFELSIGDIGAIKNK